MRIALHLALLSCLLTPIVAGDAGSEPRHRRFDDPEHWAKVWDADSREAWQKPLTVLGVLGIEQGERVADLGAGTGYFTGLLAIEVGPTGRVYAVDVEPAMLRYIESRTDFPLERIETVLADPADPKLPQGGVDLILTVNTWHHIDKRVRYIKKLGAALSDRGRVVVVDFRDGELPVGPPAGEKLSRDAVVKEFRKAGWDHVAESMALPYQYVLTFSPRREAPDRPWVRR